MLSLTSSEVLSTKCSSTKSSADIPALEDARYHDLRRRKEQIVTYMLVLVDCFVK